MRRARVLQASATRDICLFCATRQSAFVERAASISSSTALPPRRHLNSSSKAPQYASDAQIYREEAPARPIPQLRTAYPSHAPAPARTLGRQPLPVRTTRQALPVRQALPARQSLPRAPLPRQPLPTTFSRQPPPPRSIQHNQAPSPQLRQAPPLRQVQNFQSSQPLRSSIGGPAHDAQAGRYVPITPTFKRVEHVAPTAAETAPSTNRYNVNMDSRPPVMDTPQFGAIGHLRRRNELQEQYPPPPPSTPMDKKEVLKPRIDSPIQRLSQDELNRLLSSNAAGKEPNRTYKPLSKTMAMETKCFYCGDASHKSQDCSQKPLVRGPLHKAEQPQQSQRIHEAEGTLSANTETWTRGVENQFEIAPSTTWVQDEMEYRRRKDDGFDKRRKRFVMDDNTPAADAREPERRRGYQDKRPRGRAQRDDEDEDDSYISKVERKRQRKEAKRAAQLSAPEPTPLYLPEYISVTNLASMLKLRVEDFVKKLEELGFEDVQTDHVLNAEHAGLIAQEYNFEPIVQVLEEDGDLYPAPPLSPEEYAKLPCRPPVVTIMGHVDHGKTTILDYMRNSSVAASEFGGITQHIGAFSVPLASGKKITFLDTPGHSAFETMRARGATVTDIVVLVVAADDSVMPQTVEAIKHAQTARVPIIVAINKIDKQQADPDAVKLDLGRHGIEIEDFGGEVQTVCVSGKTGQGIPDLEEAISTLSEMLDHRADPQANAEGWVLEGSTKKSGKVATVLVRNGTMRPGDLLVAGSTWTRIRSLKNEAGVIVKEVGPGIAAEVDGWRDQPIAGDEVLQAVDEQQAAYVAELRTEKLEREQMARDVEAINEHRRLEAERREAEEAAIQAAHEGEEVRPSEEAAKTESGPEIVSFIVKGDVSGSVEAVMDSISSIGNGEVGTRILRHGVGPPSEFDVEHAAAANGHIVNFNTVIPSHITAMAAEKGARILDSNIIYRVVEHVKALLSEKLGPKITQRVVGEAEVAAIFDISIGGRKKMKVAGSKVRNGIISNNSKVKVLRNDQPVFEGLLTSLKNQKKDVESMRKDTECGIAFDNWEDFKVGDKIQCLEEKSEKRFL